MSFQDDAIEPLAVESAEHFAQLLRGVGTRQAGERDTGARNSREHFEPRRALPRELGN